MHKSGKKGLDINAGSFIVAIAVIFALMVLSYVLTLLIPGGSYPRIEDALGNLVIDTNSEFTYVAGGISFMKWLLSPVLILTAEGNGTIIAVIIFLLVIGGVFNCLDKCGLIRYMLGIISLRFSHVRYKLMACLVLFFMALGALIGSFEEVVPLVPIVVALAINMGWDALTGLGMSLLAVGCGFASGVCNPFTVGVALELAGLPMFSGAGMRLVSFVLIYTLLLLFIRSYARKIEKPVNESFNTELFSANCDMDRALKAFAAIIGSGIILVLCSGFIAALQSYTMIIVAFMFLAAGIISSGLSGMKAKEMLIVAKDGMISILPAVLLILMAASIKYTLEEARILDTLLHYAVKLAGTLPRWAVILFIYLLVLVMNFFIASGSAKAFMLIPLIVPMAQIFGISSQLCVMAFAFGDGFSNVFYPTNPALLIALGLADTGYNDWFRFSGKFQMLNLILTCAIILIGFAVGY